MQLRTEVLSGHEAREAVRDIWNRWVVDEPDTLRGMDATGLFEWSEAVMSSLAKDYELHLLCCYDNGDMVGILPLALPRSGRDHALRAPSDFNAGRAGLLLRESSGSVLAAMLNKVRQVAPAWRTYSTIITANSQSADAVAQLPGCSGFRVITGAPLESPAFSIRSSVAEFRSDMSPKLLQGLRTANNRFKSAGGYEVRTYTDASSAQELLSHVLAIDKQSWKEASGTSITANPHQVSFYASALPRLADAGVLLGQVLFHQGRAAAYNFGVCKDGVFCCLKLSFVQDLERLSPGRVVTASLIDLLRDRGVQTFDFMGKADPYKLQWSRSSWLYSRHSVVIFNESWIGRQAYRLACARGLARAWVGRVRSRWQEVRAPAD